MVYCYCIIIYTLTKAFMLMMNCYCTSGQITDSSYSYVGFYMSKVFCACETGIGAIDQLVQSTCNTGDTQIWHLRG